MLFNPQDTMGARGLYVVVVVVVDVVDVVVVVVEAVVVVVEAVVVVVEEVVVVEIAELVVTGSPMTNTYPTRTVLSLS